jgi:hypothetical protein
VSNSKLFYDLANACFLIYGPLFHFSEATLEYLKPSGIKSAYREKAKILHPDSSKLTNKSKQELSTLFNELNDAYNLLINYLKVDSNFKERVSNKIKLVEDINSIKYKTRKDFFYSGSIPKRKLRLGEYLYYSKKISWKTLIDAIVTQYKTRPKIGDICIKLNYLNNKEISKIIKEINISEKFGETAKKLGLLTNYQILAALGYQKRYNKAFGQYFIDNDIFTKNQIEKFIKECNQYNFNYNIIYSELYN